MSACGCKRPEGSRRSRPRARSEDGDVEGPHPSEVGIGGAGNPFPRPRRRAASRRLQVARQRFELIAPEFNTKGVTSCLAYLQRLI